MHHPELYDLKKMGYRQHVCVQVTELKSMREDNGSDDVNQGQKPCNNAAKAFETQLTVTLYFGR